MTRQDLFENLALGAALVCISVFIQVAFTLLLLKIFSRLTASGERHPRYLLRAVALTSMILIVVADHLIQIHMWGSAFYLLSYFADFWTSQYFTAQTYTTLGYGDLLLPPQRRMLSGWLALTGLLIIGWSTALFAYLIARYHEAHAPIDTRRDRRPPDG